MIFPSDAERAAKYFIEQGVDAVIVPHVNFGAEEAVALLGKLVGKPLLLWGPRDETPPPTGARQTDTQCGLFASGMVLDRYNVPFTYLENCWLDSEKLDEGVEHFVRVASVVKAFSRLRIGQISVRPRTFLTVEVNECELTERFGAQIVTIDYTEMMMEIQRILDEGDARADEIHEGLKRDYDVSKMQPEQVKKIAAMEAAFLNFAEKYNLSCFASECWRTFSVPFGIMPCAGFADLIQRGLPVACECDIHGAISSALLAAAALWQKPTFLADMTFATRQMTTRSFCGTAARAPAAWPCPASSRAWRCASGSLSWHTSTSRSAALAEATAGTACSWARARAWMAL